MLEYVELENKNPPRREGKIKKLFDGIKYYSVFNIA